VRGGSGEGRVDTAGLDDIGRQFRIARAHSSSFHREDGHRSEGARPRDRPGAGDCSARRCGPRAGARSRGRGAKFIAAGHGILRREIAWNDFIFVRPKVDPAHIAGATDAVAALRATAEAKAPFVSRGDSSGTDALEKRLWKLAGIDPTGQGWYRDIGGGMGAALNVAAAINAMTLSDRGTWLSFQNRRDLVVLLEGDPRLLNRYDVIQLNPSRHPNVKVAPARQLAEWLAGPEGQAAIGAYTVDSEQLFHPDADNPHP
jgi:tungstate transport system substrate-binding protein